jgi:hypothetical protein
MRHRDTVAGEAHQPPKAKLSRQQLNSAIRRCCRYDCKKNVLLSPLTQRLIPITQPQTVRFIPHQSGKGKTRITINVRANLQDRDATVTSH